LWGGGGRGGGVERGKRDGRGGCLSGIPAKNRALLLLLLLLWIEGMRSLWTSFYSVFLMRDVLFVHAEEGWTTLYHIRVTLKCGSFLFW
jgi:hypothetical protein